MSKMRLGLCVIAGVLAGIVPMQQAAAFEYAGQAWCCDTIYYYINVANPASACGGAVFGQWFRSSILQAAATYNARHKVYHIVERGTTAVACSSSVSQSVCLGRKDGQNTIAMSKACSWIDDNILAYSTWWYWTQVDSAGCIYESDICFNDDVMWFDDSPPCSGNCYDLLSLATHELGHWIALNHENDNTVLGYKPVMYYSFNYCEQRRSLTADDTTGLRWAYDSVGAIALPQRTVLRHLHPADAAYHTPPADDTCPGFVPPCSCPHQGDLDGSGFIDVSDVLKVIGVAFTNGADVKDPNCPTTRGDVNNSGVVDVNDVLYIIKTAFQNGPNPFNPCGP